ncbi:MAG: metal ABC transporter ATP-binding protein [Actinobacteria bacterium]|nr:metal ABC transporter ATP-binding protein [Actinomycetota bacterium]
MRGAGGTDAAVPGRLDVRDLTVSYAGITALRAVTFSCGPGEVVGVIGPNGAGQSTLLKAVLGLVDAEAGRVRVGGRPVDAVRREVAYLPQRSAIDWDYPARVDEVVAMGRYPHAGPLGRLRAADRRIAAESLERVAMTAFARSQIGELSGGQQQRVLLARALAQRADLLLLDEPFTGVDALTEQLLYERIRELGDAGATVVVVNHDLSSVADGYDRLLVLAGRVVAFGPPERVFTGELLARAYGGVPTAAGALVGDRR